MQFIATLACALFSGAAIYINLVEHPARMSCGTAAAIAQWAPSYRRATWMQAPLALVGFVSAVIAWLAGASIAWLIGGVLLGLVVPVTLVVIMPTNQRLLSADLGQAIRRSAQIAEPLERPARHPHRAEHRGAAVLPRGRSCLLMSATSAL